MTERKERKVRETIWSHGRKSDANWMRVLVDETLDRIEVHYKGGSGKRRKKFFGTNKKERAAAIKWAEAHRDERIRLGSASVDTTHEQLWKAYTKSPAFLNLRPAANASYTERCNRWELFRGAATRVDSTTLLHVDQFITRSMEQEFALNQIRQALNVARLVYNWGQTRKLVSENCFVGYRWKQPKDAPVFEPAEYTPQEFAQMIAELDPRDGRRWRAHVAMMIGGHHGGRANAVLNLTWDAVDSERDMLVWPAAFQKNGKELAQPMTWDLVAALETAFYWRSAVGYEGKWILFAGGGNKKLGAAVTKRGLRRRRQYGTQVITPVRKERTPEQDTPYTYGGLYAAIRAAEVRAGVTHREYRAFHGTRKHAAGNVADRTGDAPLAMAWIGDDIRQAPKYLKRRNERMERAAAAAATQPTERGKSE